jgi:hypothetical protein
MRYRSREAEGALWESQCRELRHPDPTKGGDIGETQGVEQSLGDEGGEVSDAPPTIAPGDDRERHR